MAAPKVLVVQHSPDDPPGRLGRWLVDGGCRLEVVHCDRGEALPENLAGYAGLVVLGGAMGAYDDAAFGWLTPTKALLAQATGADLPTLAICLGHQLLAVANGGVVAEAQQRQVGVVGLQLAPAARDDWLFGPLGSHAAAVHWNNDIVVEAPRGAVLLSSSAAGIQAFRVGTAVYGVQFHPEVEVETVTAWAAAEGDDRPLPGHVQARLAEIAAADDELEPVWQAFTQRFAARVRQPTDR